MGAFSAVAFRPVEVHLEHRLATKTPFEFFCNLALQVGDLFNGRFCLYNIILAREEGYRLAEATAVNMSEYGPDLGSCGSLAGFAGGKLATFYRQTLAAVKCSIFSAVFGH